MGGFFSKHDKSPHARPDGWSADTNEFGSRFDDQLAVARWLEQRDDTEPAKRAYNEAMKTDPKRPEPYHRLAVLHSRTGDFDESNKLYRRALKLNPKDAQLHCDVGYSYYLQGRWADAEKALRKALELNPDLARAHNNLGVLLAMAGRHDEACQEFRKSGCSDADARLNLAFALTLQNEWDAARRQYELALAADPASQRAAAGIQEIDFLVVQAGQEHHSAAMVSYHAERPAQASFASPGGTGMQRLPSVAPPPLLQRAP